jgi:hypothetical protein
MTTVENDLPEARELGEKAWRALTLNVTATPFEKRSNGGGGLSVHGEDLGSGRYRVTVLRDGGEAGEALSFHIDVPGDAVRFNGCAAGLAEFERLLTDACKTVRAMNGKTGA